MIVSAGDNWLSFTWSKISGTTSSELYDATVLIFVIYFIVHMYKWFVYSKSFMVSSLAREFIYNWFF